FHLLARLIKRNGFGRLAVGQLDEMEAKWRNKNRADFADFHRECDRFKLLGQLAALEKAKIDVFVGLIRMLFRQRFKIGPALNFAAEFSKFFIGTGPRLTALG